MVQYQSLYLTKLAFKCAHTSVCHLNLKIPTASENTNRISENTHRIYLKMAKCRLTRLAWSAYVVIVFVCQFLHSPMFHAESGYLWANRSGGSPMNCHVPAYDIARFCQNMVILYPDMILGWFITRW